MASPMAAQGSQSLCGNDGVGSCGSFDSANGRGNGMGWVQAGFVLFAFAAPSACVGVAYSIGMAGIVGGSLLCIGVTAASAAGSLMLLRLRLSHRSCNTLGELGLEILGRPGKIWGDVIQLGNFLLFLPVALLFCASALKGALGSSGCSDYYIFAVAGACLLTTQVRTLRATSVWSFLSLVSVFLLAGLQIAAAFTFTSSARVPAQLFGNPETHPGTRFVQALLGTTTAAWSYVPAFLTVELAGCMERPQKFGWSLMLSAVLNCTVFIGVGVAVVSRWGYNIADPITITDGVGAWQSGAWPELATYVCLLVGNFVSYMLDSVPLARSCQRTWAPNFQDTWRPADIVRYLGYSLPTFLFGLMLSVLVPNLFVLLAFTTALTIPWVTQIYPAVLYWNAFGGARSVALPGGGSSAAAALRGAAAARGKMSMRERCGVIAVFLVGCASFVVCLAAAVGKVAIREIRGPSQIGCDGWIIWQG